MIQPQGIIERQMSEIIWQKSSLFHRLCRQQLKVIGLDLHLTELSWQRQILRQAMEQISELVGVLVAVTATMEVCWEGQRS
jgi:CHASE2 domain-containing sensor protein